MGNARHSAAFIADARLCGVDSADSNGHWPRCAWISLGWFAVLGSAFGVATGLVRHRLRTRAKPPTPASVPSSAPLRPGHVFPAGSPRVAEDSRSAPDSSAAPGSRRAWRNAVALGLAVLFGLASVLLFGDLGSHRGVERPSGGIILATAVTAEDEILPSVSASVQAEIWETGWDGISEMHLTIQFEEPRSGLRWFVIPSGQYEIAAGTPTHAHCIYYPERRREDIVECPADTGATRYRPGGLGSLHERSVVRISDSFDGYEDATASIIEGTLRRDALTREVPDEVDVMVPIRTPQQATAGSDTYGALAPVAAVNVGDFGTTERVGVLPARYATDTAFLAEKQSGIPLDPVDVSRITVSVRDSPEFESVAFSSPPVTSSDRLEWSNGDLRTSGMRYVLHDSLAETSLIRRSFLAGLCASLALAFLFLIFEQWFHRAPRRLR